jgi:hypothetical protein
MPISGSAGIPVLSKSKLPPSESHDLGNPNSRKMSNAASAGTPRVLLFFFPIVNRHPRSQSTERVFETSKPSRSGVAGHSLRQNGNLRKHLSPANPVLLAKNGQANPAKKQPGFPLQIWECKVIAENLCLRTRYKMPTLHRFSSTFGRSNLSETKED